MEELPEDVRAVTLCALSRVIGHGRTRHPTTFPLCRGLAFFAREDAAHGRVLSPGPAPELPVNGWPSGSTGQRRVGASGYELYHALRELKRKRGAYACFPEEFIAEFVPRSLWPVVDRLIVDGPALSCTRADNAMETASRVPVAGNRRRATGPPSRAYLKSHIGELQRLFNALVALRGEHFEADCLQPWEVAPRVGMPEAASHAYAVQAPPVEVVRLKWAELQTRVREALRAATYEEELQAVRQMGVATIYGRSVWEPVELRALLAVYVITSGRRGAVQRLRREDLLLDHVGPMPDCRRGAALRLRPEKTKGLTEVSIKPIPDELASVLVTWTTLVDRMYEARAVGHPSWNGTAALGKCDPEFPATGALFPAAMGGTEPRSYDGIGSVFAGHTPTKVHLTKRGKLRARNGRRALIPRHGAIPADVLGPLHDRLAADARRQGYDEPTTEQTTQLVQERCGYTLHEYRHLAFQLAKRAGALYNKTQAGQETQQQPDPADYAHALLDHQGPAEIRLKRIYGDLNSPQVVELLAGRAIDGMWQLLTTDLGSRRRPDIEAYRDRLGELRAVEADLERLSERANRFHSNPVLHAALLAPTPPALPPDADDSAKLTLLVHYAEAMHSQMSRMTHALSELRHIGLTASELTFKAVRLSERRAVLARTLEELRHNRALWKLVPDDAPAELMDLSLLEEHTLGRALTNGEQAEAIHVREWVTIREFGELAGVRARSTVSRWIAGTNLPTRAEERPWEPGEAPVDQSQGTLYRRIWIPGVNSEFWASRPPAARARREEMLGTWPKEQGWSSDGHPGPRCFAALELTEPWRSIYYDEELCNGEPELAFEDLRRDLPGPAGGGLWLDDEVQAGDGEASDTPAESAATVLSR